VVLCLGGDRDWDPERGYGRVWTGNVDAWWKTSCLIREQCDLVRLSLAQSLRSMRAHDAHVTD
jgi:hypothetical protein